MPPLWSYMISICLMRGAWQGQHHGRWKKGKDKWFNFTANGTTVSGNSISSLRLVKYRPMVKSEPFDWLTAEACQWFCPRPLFSSPHNQCRHLHMTWLSVNRTSPKWHYVNKGSATEAPQHISMSIKIPSQTMSAMLNNAISSLPVSAEDPSPSLCQNRISSPCQRICSLALYQAKIYLAECQQRNSSLALAQQMISYQ